MTRPEYREESKQRIKPTVGGYMNVQISMAITCVQIICTKFNVIFACQIHNLPTLPAYSSHKL